MMTRSPNRHQQAEVVSDAGIVPCILAIDMAMSRDGGDTTSREPPIFTLAVYEFASRGHGRRAICAIPTVRPNPLHLATVILTIGINSDTKVSNLRKSYNLLRRIRRGRQ